MISIIKYRIKRFVPGKIWLTFSQIIKNKKEVFFSEQRKQFGNTNENIEIYIIRRKPPGGGLFSNVNHVLQGLIYAKEMKMYPVVDMKNYATEYSQIYGFNGEKNAWEYFFNPVSNISLRDSYKSKNVILSEGDRILKNHIMSGRNLAYILDKEFLEEAHKVYGDHINLNKYTKLYIEYILNVKDIDSDSTLGVFLRGTDYLLGPTGHPIQPHINEVIKDIYNFLGNKPIKKILLSTDDLQLRKKLEAEFGDLMLESIRSDTESLFSNQLRDLFEIPEGAIARNLSYLSEIYILSKLSFNISSLSNGSAIMYVINGGKFTDSKLYYYGVN
jgi:hypothetical protein